MKRKILLILLSCLFFYFIEPDYSFAEVSPETSINYLDQNIENIRSVNGKLYASIVLLFNENPHFLNLIQEDSITSKMLQKGDFNLSMFNNYLAGLKDDEIRKYAELALKIYQHPESFNEKMLKTIEEELSQFNIILRFSKERSSAGEKIVLDYCIFGRKIPLKIIHPLFDIKEKIYNIQPFIYYDEFSTSNSTFYFDMIYINPDEVLNDSLICRKILHGEQVDTMFFVGAKVSEDIQYCITHAFQNVKSIKTEILRMFEIHELTHKILNNHYNYYDQVTGEELSLISTILTNHYLGLSVLYSYLEYTTNNPHRIAASNYLRFIANRTGKLDLMDNPSGLKLLPSQEIKKLSIEHFNSIIKNLK